MFFILVYFSLRFSLALIASGCSDVAKLVAF